MKRFFSAILCAVLLLVLAPVLPQTVSAESVSNFNIRLTEPVASYTPDFSPEFNTNVQLYTNVTWKENSPGFNMTLNSSDEFKAGLAYKVEIWVLFGDNSYLATDSQGDLAAALTVNGKAISHLEIKGRNNQNKINEVMITCEYGPLSGSVISSVLVTGVPTPVAGDMPIYSFTVDSSAYSYYHTAPVVWWDVTTGREMDSGDTFIQGHKYQVNIWLQANREGGFTFKTDQSGNSQVSATINSWAADSVTKAYEQDGREVIDIRYTFPACPAAHTCAPTLVQLQKPTCVMPGFKAYYECVCGKFYEDAAGKKEITDMDGYGILPADGHKEGAWSYDGTYHYKKCTTCNEVIPGTKVAHTGGTASCIQKAKCSVCNAPYGQLDPEHRWGPGWDYKDASGHAWVCADCKTHSQVKAHKPGPAATETTPQKCSECNYVIEPAKNHTHKLTKVEKKDPTCAAAGNIAYYLCDSCGKLFSDEKAQQEIASSVLIPILQHEADEKWTNDDINHWKACRYCALQLTDTVQLHQADGDNCSVCGYSFSGENPSQGPEATGTESENTETKPNAPADKEEPGKKEGIPGWSIAVMIGLICFGAAIVVTVIIIKKKKQ